MGVHGEPFPRRQPMCQCASKPWSPLPTVRVVLYMLQTKTRRCCASAPMTLRCCVTVTAPTIGAGIFNGWVFLWRWGCNLVNIGLLSECCSANLDCWRQVKSSSRVLRRKAADPIRCDPYCPPPYPCPLVPPQFYGPDLIAKSYVAASCAFLAWVHGVPTGRPIQDIEGRTHVPCPPRPLLYCTS